jgi:S1-C subfamily serine protease
MNESKKRQSSLKIAVIMIAVAIVFALIGAASVVVYDYLQTENRAEVTSRQGLKDDGNLKSTNDEQVVSNIVDTVSPSVVSIVTNVTVSSIFGVANQQAAGSGIVVSKEGYILTNKHVVDGANSISVVMSDGTTHDDVELIGVDPMNDVAYLKIKNVNDLKPATLGDSSTVRVGQGVIAIGNSLGQYQNTVTSGIISGKGRPVTAGNDQGSMAETLTDLLQTDAAINPGNSGGPLLNRSGQVIGMNTAVAANAEGIGFAIPINATKGTLKSVLAGKGVQRAYLGLRYVQVTAEVAKKYDLPTKQGAYIIGDSGAPAIVADGPADKAGLQEKDIITKINGLLVGPQGGVSSLVGEYAPGDTVEVTYLRGSREATTKVTLAAYPQV